MTIRKSRHLLWRSINQSSNDAGQSAGSSNHLDNYVQRYGEDTELANQARTDLQTGLTNTAGLVRDDIGRVLQAQAIGQTDLARQQAQGDAAIGSIDCRSSC